MLKVFARPGTLLIRRVRLPTALPTGGRLVVLADDHTGDFFSECRDPFCDDEVRLFVFWWSNFFVHLGRLAKFADVFQ